MTKGNNLFMKPSHVFILAFLAALFYWFFDAYANTLLYHTRLSEELFLTPTHNVAFLKLTITLCIFAAVVSPSYLKKEPLHENTYLPCIEELDGLKQLSEILYSPLSPKINIAKALEKLNSLLGLEASILFIYQKETLTIYNETPFVQSHFQSKELFPFRPNAFLSQIEKIAHTCFLEKRLLSHDSVTHENHKLTVSSFCLKESKSEQFLGSLMLVSSHPQTVENHKELIHKLIDQLTFTLFIALKKEQFMLTNQPTSEMTGVDKELSIVTYIKFMEKLEHEFKRNRRYHTELTLMLIDIPVMQNLSNIFSQTIIANVKKDFIQVLKKNIREVDLLGKWTNEQYAMMLPDVDFRAAQVVAKKIQGLLENYKFPHVGKLTCSFGITSLSQKDKLSSFRLRAENALAIANMQEGNPIEVKLLV